ncbi:MAG TPA: hypothetical protein VJN93_15735 [Candidatus Acidoferrum sp.]|nr:hypothetical protein [Candidatus Acidoferrum sp.]
MADVGQLPNLWQQIRLIAALRWRIVRNSLRKKNNQWDLIGLIFTAVFGSILVLGLSVAFFFAAYMFLTGGRERWFGLLFWAIFLIWQFFPLFTAGFSSGFEFRSLLRFPLHLPAFYLVGLAYGLANVAAIASLCWLIALNLGAGVANPGVLPVLVPLSLLFILLNVTLERLIGSWLERILARRRSREILFAIFVLFAISFQFINVFFQRFGGSAHPWVHRVLPYLAIFPPSLAGHAVLSVVQHEAISALADFAGIFIYVLFFTTFLWMRFATQYRGEELSESLAPAITPPRVSARAVSQSEDSQSTTQKAAQPMYLHWLSPQVAAIFRKEFRYLTRNSFSFFLLIMPPVFVLLFTFEFAGHNPVATKHPISSELFFPGMMAYLVIILMGPAYNSFAYDGKAILAYFTAPLHFRTVFLGKNLLHIALLVFELALSTGAFVYFVGLPSTSVLLATIMAIVFYIAGQLSIANWSSLSFPRKLNFGQMRGQRQSGMAVLVAFGAQLLLAGICAPILFLSGWTGDRWLPAELFTFLAAIAIAGYVASLDPLSALAEKKKESMIDALSR